MFTEIVRHQSPHTAAHSIHYPREHNVLYNVHEILYLLYTYLQTNHILQLSIARFRFYFILSQVKRFSS